MNYSPVSDAICSILQKIPNIHLSGHKFTPLNEITNEIKNDFSVFSYKEDFSTLWGENDAIASIAQFCGFQTDKKFRTIIVWDGYPEVSKVSGAVPIKNWVTPIDWALCASLTALEKATTSVPPGVSIADFLPDWSVMIIDLVSQNYPGVHSASLLNNNPAMIPWLRLYRPVISSKDSENIQYDSLIIEEGKHPEDHRYSILRAMTKDDLMSFIGDIQNPGKVLGLNASYNTLDSLAAIWSANILRPGDRHQVANMIAPLVLFQSLRIHDSHDDMEPLHNSIFNLFNSALKVQLTTLHLIDLPAHTESKRTRKTIQRIRNLLARLDKKTQIRLVDDQYVLGYDKILSYILGSTHVIKCECSADDIFNTLQKHILSLSKIDTPGWRCSIYPEPTILFLDLRLWTDAEVLKIFYSRLRDMLALYFDNIQEASKGVFVKYITATQNTDDFKDYYTDFQREALMEDWKSLKDVLNAEKPSDDLLALTLLPRLLSCIDPFLPIVLFSSSSQRETLAAFYGYPNIISCFQKPMPAGYKARLTPVDYLEDLSEAFYKATLLCLMRPISDRLCQLEKDLFINKRKLSIKINQEGKFKDVIINSTMAGLDLRRAMQTILPGEYKYGAALPHMLIETWLNYDNKNRNRDGQTIMPATDPGLNKERNAFAHMYTDFCHDESSDTVIAYIEKTLNPIWDRFFSYIEKFVLVDP